MYPWMKAILDSCPQASLNNFPNYLSKPHTGFQFFVFYSKFRSQYWFFIKGGTTAGFTFKAFKQVVHVSNNIFSRTEAHRGLLECIFNEWVGIQMFFCIFQAAPVQKQSLKVPHKKLYTWKSTGVIFHDIKHVFWSVTTGIKTSVG